MATSSTWVGGGVVGPTCMVGASVKVLGSSGIDAPDDFVDGRDVVLDQSDCLLLQRPHALGDGDALKLFLGGPADDQAPDLGGDLQHLEHADAVLVAGVG